jgi:acid phosphatase
LTRHATTRRSGTRNLAILGAWVLTSLLAATAAAQPPNLGEAKTALIAYHDFGAYERDLEAVTQQAAAYLTQHVAEAKKPAIVFDIDDTALSTWPTIVANDFGYLDQIPCAVLPKGSCDRDGFKVVALESRSGPKVAEATKSVCETKGCTVVECKSLPNGSCDAEGYRLIPCDNLPKGPCGGEAYDLKGLAPIVQTLRVAQVAQDKGVAIFFITGRHEVEREATEKNLRNAGYPAWMKVFMRPDGTSTESAADYKAPVRAQIEKMGYTIVVNIGDQPSDLKGGHAEGAFLLPNPFYRIP